MEARPASIANVPAPEAGAAEPAATAAAHDEVLVLDFGGQYSQLIARRVRECGVFSELLPHTVPIEEIERRGGRVLIDRPAAGISHGDGAFLVTAGAPDSFRSGHDPRDFSSDGDERYDAVLVTVSNPIFERLLDERLRESLPAGYLGRVRSVEYHAARACRRPARRVAT